VPWNSCSPYRGHQSRPFDPRPGIWWPGTICHASDEFPGTPTRTSSSGLWPTPTLAGACVSVSSTISYALYLGPEAVRPGEAALRGSSRVVPGYWGVRPVRHQLGTPIIPKSSVRLASHPKGCDDLRKAGLGSRCIRTRDKDTHEAVVERAIGQDVGQDAGPVSIRIIRRSARRSDHYAEASDDPTITPKRYTSEPSGKMPGPSRIETHRSDTSKPSGKTPGPSRSESFAEASDDPTITLKRQTI